jgi:hypothetical protein
MGTGKVSRDTGDGSEQIPKSWPDNVKAASSRVQAERIRKKSGPPKGGWTWITREMLESPAWAAMSRSARLVVDRILLELIGNAGYDNGALQVTYNDFEKYGLGRKSITSAIKEAQALGWIKVTQPGRGGRAGSLRRAHRFALTWLHTATSDPTNGWKRFQTMAMVNTVLANVRKLRTPPTRSEK